MTAVSRTTGTTGTTADTAPVGRTAGRVGLVITGLVALFLLFDSVTKLLRLPFVVEATEQMGFPASTVPIIGGTLLVCLALYLIPRTAVLGAVLLTGYLGGAVCAQLRLEAPLFSTLLFPVYTGVLVWLGLYLRSAALRALVRAGS
jgi:DoxX-like family